jgi:hypothetical protein
VRSGGRLSFVEHRSSRVVFALTRAACNGRLHLSGLTCRFRNCNQKIKKCLFVTTCELERSSVPQHYTTAIYAFACQSTWMCPLHLYHGCRHCRHYQKRRRQHHARLRHC